MMTMTIEDDCDGRERERENNKHSKNETENIVFVVDGCYWPIKTNSSHSNIVLGRESQEEKNSSSLKNQFLVENRLINQKVDIFSFSQMVIF